MELSRKANKAEVDTKLANKADLGDIKRIYGMMGEKIDMVNFE